VLPAVARLRRREDFTLVVRRGRRAGRGALVVHYLAPPAALAGPRPVPACVGFVVGRAVGGSVERHRVLRRLRHLVRARLDGLPAGARLVVRALPPAAGADSAALGRDLDAALDRLLGARPAALAAEPAAAAAAPAALAAPAEVRR
jgi:ribonuclease P protein component